MAPAGGLNPRTADHRCCPGVVAPAEGGASVASGAEDGGQTRGSDNSPVGPRRARLASACELAGNCWTFC